MKLRGLSRNGWTGQHLFALIGLVAIGFYVTFDAWLDIFLIATRDQEASHIFLVPIVAGWLAWVRRGRFRHCRPAGAILGPALVILGWAISSIGYHHAIQSFWHGGAVLVIIGCVLSVLGRDVLVRFFPVFAVLVFLVPVPGMARQQIAIPLQTATAHVTQAIFSLMGKHIERSGNVLTVNGVDVAIAEACNGMRMVFALVLVSYTFAFSTPLKTFARILVIVASPLSAIVCNVIRLIPTVWLYGHQVNVAQSFHDMSGWVMLPIAFLILVGIIRVLRWALIPVTYYTLAYD